MTVKFKSNDPLQKLLRDAMRKQEVEVKAQQQRHTHCLVEDPGDLYKPTAWKPGREAVLVVHVAVTGARTLIGVFQEQLNSRAHGSRLIPLPPDPQRSTAGLPQIEVHGDYWLQPSIHHPQIETPEEIQQLTERFHELLASYN